MSQELIHALLLSGWAVLLGLAATALFRRSLISFRYWLGWLALAALQLIAALVAGLVSRDLHYFGIGAVGWVVVAFVAVSLFVAVQLSISISGHQRMLVMVAQECALLRLRIEELETARQQAERPDHPGA